jgi:lysophospholipid acyltransferase (LPLAT)-like uncharacterized protein
VAIAVDGPRGPTRQPKAGPLEIARLCGVPIVPVAARATGELRFRSWDRFLVPLPRAHVAFTFGEPLFYGPEAPDEAELELRRRVLAARIDELEAYTAGLVHQPRRHPLAKLVAWRLPG